MNVEKMGQWVGILANLGILLGFVLVAYQLQLNTTALQTTSKHKTNELFSNAEMALMGDTGNAAFAHALLDPDSVTPEEMVQNWSYFSLGFYSASQVYFDYKDGLVSEERWLYIADLFISYFNHPIGLSLWRSMKGVYSDPSMNQFLEVIQARLDETPKNLTQKQFRELVEEFGVGTTQDI